MTAPPIPGRASPGSPETPYPFTFVLSPVFRGAWNRARQREAGDTARAAIFGGISIAVALGIFGVVFWLTWQLLDYEELGQYLIRLGLSWLFLTFLSFVLFSAVVTALSTFFLSEDLRLLLAAPVPRTTLFYSRLAKTAVQSSWMVVVFMVPVLFGVGVAHCAGLTYYLSALMALIPFVLIPVALGAITTLWLVNVFPARHARDILMFMGLFFAITLHGRGFLETTNLLNIVRQTAVIAVMAVAMTFVLAAGEIDLSIGALAGLASVTAALAIDVGGPLAGAVGGVATGLAVGLINGLITTRIGIPSFLTTLAMMGIARGVAMWVSDTRSIPIVDRAFPYFFGGGDLGPVPTLLLWTVLFGVVGHLALRRTTFGRKVLATGGNEVAARFTGIDTRFVKLRVLILSGFAAGMAGMLYAGRLHSGRFQFGEGDELSVIAAAVLGGTSLFGGKGTVVGSIVGALMIGLINNGLILMGLEFSQQLIARGVIIILAVAIRQTRR